MACLGLIKFISILISRSILVATSLLSLEARLLAALFVPTPLQGGAEPAWGGGKGRGK